MTRNPHLRKEVLALLLVMGTAPLAFAQGTSNTTEAGAQAATRAQAGSAASVSADAKASARTELAQRLEERAAKVSAKSQAEANGKLEAAAKKLDASQEGAGEAKIAARIGAEFGMTTQAVLDQKQALDASWGNLMIAHTLAANASSDADATVANLEAMHEAGMGWGKIAAGLGLNLGQSLNAVAAESRVAAGLTRADGKVASIGADGATQAALRGATHANVNANANAAAKAADATASVSVDGAVGHALGHVK
ncbi:MAG: hypothetical protein ABI960_02630 [Candidatus Eisenbacteria bacterium]